MKKILFVVAYLLLINKTALMALECGDISGDPSIIKCFDHQMSINDKIGGPTSDWTVNQMEIFHNELPENEIWKYAERKENGGLKNGDSIQVPNSFVAEGSYPPYLLVFKDGNNFVSVFLKIPTTLFWNIDRDGRKLNIALSQENLKEVNQTFEEGELISHLTLYWNATCLEGEMCVPICELTNSCEPTCEETGDCTPKCEEDNTCTPDCEEDGTCISETGYAYGDPHFKGGDGGKFDFHGTNGKVYKLVDEKDWFINSLFSKRKNGTTIISKTGLLLDKGGSNISILAKSNGSLSINGIGNISKLPTNKTITIKGYNISHFKIKKKKKIMKKISILPRSIYNSKKIKILGVLKVVTPEGYTIEQVFAARKISRKKYAYRIDVGVKTGSNGFNNGQLPFGIIGSTFDNDSNKVLGVPNNGVLFERSSLFDGIF